MYLLFCSRAACARRDGERPLIAVSASPQDTAGAAHAPPQTIPRNNPLVNCGSAAQFCFIQLRSAAQYCFIQSRKRCAVLFNSTAEALRSVHSFCATYPSQATVAMQLELEKGKKGDSGTALKYKNEIRIAKQTSDDIRAQLVRICARANWPFGRCTAFCSSGHDPHPPFVFVVWCSE